MVKLSLGCASFSNCYGELSYQECLNLVKSALSNDIYHFDTSPFYGNSEQILGTIIDELNLGNDPKIKISTKIGRYGEYNFDFGAEKTKSSIENSLKLLKRPYLDIVFCHDIEFANNLDQIINETIPTLKQLQKEGKVKKVGISGLPLSVLDYIISKQDIDVVLTYCSYCLHYNKLNLYQKKWKDKNIEIMYGGVTSMGLLTKKGPPEWHPASKSLKSFTKMKAESLESKNTNITQIAFNYTLLNNYINTILVGPNNIFQLNNYLEWIRTPLDTKYINQVYNEFTTNQEVWIENGTQKNINISFSN